MWALYLGSWPWCGNQQHIIRLFSKQIVLQISSLLTAFSLAVASLCSQLHTYTQLISQTEGEITRIYSMWDKRAQVCHVSHYPLSLSSNTSLSVQTYAKSNPTSYIMICWMQICVAGFEVYFRDRIASYLLFSSSIQTTTVSPFGWLKFAKWPCRNFKHIKSRFKKNRLRLSSNDKMFFTAMFSLPVS